MLQIYTQKPYPIYGHTKQNPYKKTARNSNDFYSSNKLTNKNSINKLSFTGLFSFLPSGMTLEKSLLKHELLIKDLAKEVYLILDHKGSVLNSDINRQVKNLETRSAALCNADIKLLKGNVVTHNHPAETPPSSGDVRLFAENEIAELRVVTSSEAFSIKPKGSWTKEKKEDILFFCDKLAEKIQKNGINKNQIRLYRELDEAWKILVKHDIIEYKVFAWKK